MNNLVSFVFLCALCDHIKFKLLGLQRTLRITKGRIVRLNHTGIQEIQTKNLNVLPVL